MKKGPADYRQVGEYDNHLFSYNDNQQHIADTIINLVEDDFDILSIKLPLQPGSDLFSKNLWSTLHAPENTLENRLTNIHTNLS
ncbi:hypothetical protein BCV71DRAFT_18129 [Rhizopus microsporus]|uniref:Uncharacterized protein n=1 Tax=Rhizopus microsporus TaxID=58291 RepID=A0A1X0SCT9_RHIZD|nr:hypothetical protein BCV71DRAFT_18129 [Rhizopus microsporus]